MFVFAYAIILFFLIVYVKLKLIIKERNRYMKKSFKIFIITLIALLITGCSNNKDSNDKDDNLLSGKHKVEISIKDYGLISLELDADVAPITVTNFVNLTKEGFYDGLKFHRIIEGFMMQGGQSETTEVDNIKGEFESNGITNNISHKRGVISMARANDYDSASSQFFIVQEDSPHLDNEYAAFGHVTKGIEIVDKICSDADPIDGNGSIEDSKRPVIESIKYLGKK